MKKTKKVDTNVHGTIISFSEKDVSHVPLFKNMAKVVKDQFGSKKEGYCQIYGIDNQRCLWFVLSRKSKSTFENYQPKNIILKHGTCGLVHYCQYHVNIDYLWKSLKKILPT